MYKFMDLIKRRNKITTVMFIIFDELINWSLAMNPMKGGIPAREDNPIRYFHELSPASWSSNDFVPLLFSMSNTDRRAIQYMEINSSMVLIPMNFLISIHLKLNTDEKAKILTTLLVMYCERLPTTPPTIREMVITTLFMGIRMYRGASFCHDIKMKLFACDNFFVTSMNHLCNGTAPNFMRIARIIRACAILDLLGIFTMSIAITKAEAAD